MIDKRIKKAFVLQQDEKDCGVACLKMIIRFYGSDISLEKLKRESGTSSKGTNLLGLYQAAKQNQLLAEGFEASIKDLYELNSPTILHVTLEGNYNHFIVYFPTKGKQFLIGDPADGLTYYTEESLQKIWKSGYLLKLEPTSDFISKGLYASKNLKWLREHLMEDKNLFYSAIFLGAILSLLGIVTAVFTQQLVDDILPERNLHLLLKALSCWGVLLLIQIFLSYLRQILMYRQSYHFNQRVISYFLGKLLFLRKSFFDSKKQGDMIARMNDSQKIQSAIQYVLGQAMIDAMLLIVSFGFLFYYNVAIALFALSIAPILLLLLAIYLKPLKEKQRKVMHQHAINESNYIETTGNIDTVKNFQKEDFFQNKAQEIYKQFQKNIYSFRIFSSKFDLSIDSINTICMVFTIAFASFLYLEQKIELGELIAAITIVNLLIGSIENLVLANVNIQGAKVALERMFEFTEEEKEIITAEHKEIQFKELKCENVNFAYPGQLNLLKNISFSFRKGEIISILGENGCGKSSLLQILQKFYSNYSGSIFINQKELKEINTNSWRNLLAVVPQQIKIFNGSVLDNICMENGDNREEEIIAFCKKYEFHSYFSKLPHSYHTVIGEEGVNLSGGEKQILALARALFKKPQILLLDEATSAMDRNTELFVLNKLILLQKQVSIIFITHRLHILKILNGKILVMEDGEIMANGTHEELLNQKNLYSNYWKDLLYA